MRSLSSLLCALLLGAVGAGAQASPAVPKNSVEYLTLPQAQNTDAANQVEVTEFFAYSCPHCNAFEPVLEAWVRKQGGNIVFKRVHVTQGPAAAPQQRLYFTLEAMGLLPQYHAKVFAAMHEERLRLNTDELVFDWAAKAGIDRIKFIDTYRSFGMQAKVRRAGTMMESYGIDQWPMVAIDGRYLTSPYQASQGMPDATATEAVQQQAATQVMDFLVAKAKATKK